MCKRRFLDIDILGPTCQLSLGQECSGEHHRKSTDNLWLRQCFLSYYMWSPTSVDPHCVNYSILIHITVLASTWT